VGYPIFCRTGLDTHSYAPFPILLGEPVGIGIPHEEVTTITKADSLATYEPRHLGRGYTSSQPLLDMENTLVFPSKHAGWASPINCEAPSPYPWEPKFLPEHWVYTDGSDITGHPRLGAAVVHILTITTIYIDDTGTEEARTIMRAELVAIHTALSTFSTHEWIGIFTNSLSSLQAIGHHHTKSGTPSAKHYHHHRLLLESITDLTETRRSSGLSTTLHKIRAHTNIRGNDLAEAAAKLSVTHYDTLLPPKARRAEIGEIAPHPHYWDMYTAKPPPPAPALSTGTNSATLCRPWWTIPEAERLQVHVFTRPSLQLRLKV